LTPSEPKLAKPHLIPAVPAVGPNPWITQSSIFTRPALLTLSNNGSAVNAVGSGQVKTFGYNHVTGPTGTGFTGSIGVQ
jgi:hypothetical protein